MKTTDKNEIDLLLRALGRDASTRSAGASSREIGAHLDADELNCYAEGVVSSAERARYNKHLADCESCRRIVVALVPAASVSRGYEAVERTEWHWRDRLSALFAPSVLRYAVPALALTAIIAIAIVALRQRQNTEFLAQNQTPTLPAVSTGDEGQRSTTNNGPQSSASPGKQQQPVAELKEKSLSQPQKSDVTQPPAAAPSKAASGDRAAKGFLQPGQSASGAESQPTFAAEPTEAAAPPAPPRAVLDDASKVAEAGNQERDADIQKRRREDNYSQAREENEVARPTSAKGGPSRNNSQNVAGLSSVMSRSGNKDAKTEGGAVETRSVSGRLFHRQGNAWVDADYASGRATVNVSRGSEQFRALIADEPALRSIAEQLGGEVIVVWKGTAYRIR